MPLYALIRKKGSKTYFQILRARKGASRKKLASVLKKTLKKGLEARIVDIVQLKRLLKKSGLLLKGRRVMKKRSRKSPKRRIKRRKVKKRRSPKRLRKVKRTRKKRSRRVKRSVRRRKRR